MFPRRQFLAFSAVALAPSLAFAPQLAFAQDAQDPATFVSAFAQNGIVDILTANIPPAEKQKRFRDMFKRDFDIPAIGRFVLGRSARGLAPGDQQSFDTLFEDVIVYTWSRRFSEYNGQTLKVTGSGPDGDQGSLVKSTVVGKGGDSFTVDWRIRKRPEGYRVVDVIVGGVSMAITYRNEYANIIAQNGGVAGLIAQLRQQVDSLKSQQAT
ncbi:MAG: ABC transporter substrate-binding protein [Rhodospirillaceae bacterium]|nr:ABC transporter substrate-binding protein [Rhodospirillaceae bacterium]